VFAFKGDAGKQALDRWLAWAQRCRIPAFSELRRKIVKHRAAIDATLEHGLSNALIESTNTKIRLLTASRSGSEPPTPSSPSPCSHSAVTDLPSQAETDRRKHQKSLISLGFRLISGSNMCTIGTWGAMPVSCANWSPRSTVCVLGWSPR